VVTPEAVDRSAEMTMVATTIAPPPAPSDRALGGRFTETPARGDLARLRDRFAAGDRCRALTPNHTFGLFGVDSAIWTRHGWFGYADHRAVIGSTVESIGDRRQIGYRFGVHIGDVLSLREQRAFCPVADGRIVDISLVYSGSRPAPEDAT
jgi:hypothetical protein